MASALALIANLNLNDLNAFPKGIITKIREYANTKLCNILFTAELARRLKGTGIDTNCLHPGVIQSDFFRNVSPIIKTYNKTIGRLYYKVKSVRHYDSRLMHFF